MEGWRGGATAAAEGCSLGFPAQRQAKQRVVPIKVQHRSTQHLERFAGPRKESHREFYPPGMELSHPPTSRVRKQLSRGN